MKLSPAEKLKRLKMILSGMGSAVLAYSGGADSTFLLKIARDVLGDKLLAVTASSETYPASEEKEAVRLARRYGVRHRIIRTCELKDPRFRENSPRRCYRCKTELFRKLKKISGKEGFGSVADGANSDDLRDYRPGLQAAGELDVRHPLIEAGLAKDDIRILSRRMGLPTWNKPAYACLASRIPYGRSITKETLKRIDEAEHFLRKTGLRQVRVRDYGTSARVEAGKKEMGRLWKKENRERIVRFFKSIGYRYVAADMEGYRTGSLNEGLALKKEKK